MDEKNTSFAAVDLLRNLTVDQIKEHLDTLEAERQAWCTLLRSARARENAVKRRNPSQKGERRG